MEKEISLNVCGGIVILDTEIIQGIELGIANLGKHIRKYNHGINCTNVREFFESRNESSISEEVIMKDLTLMGFENLANEISIAYAQQIYLQKT